MRTIRLNHTERDQWVDNPFLGSGTTRIATELPKRACWGLPIESAGGDVAVRRRQDLTGQQATFESDGHVFADPAEWRGVLMA